MDHAPSTYYHCHLCTVGAGCFARAAVRGPAVGVTVPNRYSLAEGRQIAPYHRAPRLGPRAFNISVVNSFGGGFVWLRHLYWRINFKLNRAAALAEWCQLLSA